MPRPTNFIARIRDLVRNEVNQAIAGLLGSLAPAPARRGKRRGPGRPKGSKNRPKPDASTVVAKRGPGRPPGSKNKRRGPGRPKGSKNKPKA